MVKRDAKLQQEIGGNFEAVGKLEYYLLRSLGLTNNQTVVDIGCGCGRLATQLGAYEGIKYFGCDLDEAYLDYARSLVDRDDWVFKITSETSIPFPDHLADFVCFFSVVTHLHHEDSFRYLREAKRLLRPEGKVVFSFLEFRIPSHWEIFEKSVASGRYGELENQFIDRDAIQSWAKHLNLKVTGIWDGDKPQFPIPEVIVWDGGQRMENQGWLGQSVAVLSRTES